MGSLTDQDLMLSERELSLLAIIDSSYFGHLKTNPKLKQLLQKAIRCIQNYVSQERDDKNSKENLNARRIYSKLGHFHLLLEDYTEALEAYQKHFSENPDCWRDASFQYGLGLVYFHFNAYQW